MDLKEIALTRDYASVIPTVRISIFCGGFFFHEKQNKTQSGFNKSECMQVLLFLCLHYII